MAATCRGCGYRLRELADDPAKSPCSRAACARTTCRCASMPASNRRWLRMPRTAGAHSQPVGRRNVPDRELHRRPRCSVKDSHGAAGAAAEDSANLHGMMASTMAR